MEAQAAIANATDTSGSATGISVSTTGFNGSNTAGTQAATGNAAIFDIASTRDSLFGNAFANFNGVLRPIATVTFGGLDATGSTTYSFDLFASRLGGTLNRETEYVVAGLNTGTVFLNAADNLSNVVSVNNIIPTGAGEITLTMDPGPNNTTTEGFYYLGALRLTSIPEPSSALMAVFGAVLCLSRRRRIPG